MKETNVKLHNVLNPKFSYKHIDEFKFLNNVSQLNLLVYAPHKQGLTSALVSAFYEIGARRLGNNYYGQTGYYVNYYFLPKTDDVNLFYPSVLIIDDWTGEDDKLMYAIIDKREKEYKSTFIGTHEEEVSNTILHKIELVVKINNFKIIEKIKR